jgi:hypothetical protein
VIDCVIVVPSYLFNVAVKVDSTFTGIEVPSGKSGVM